MSTADLYEDGYPHATREGYDRGCRGKNCPGTADHGRSCVEAYTRYQGDYTFRKRTDAGLTPDEITAAELADRAAPTKQAPAVAATPKTAAPKPATPKTAKTARHALADDASSDLPMAAGHGTTTGYSNGCRGTGCPSKVAGGRSCSEAQSAKMREYYQRRKAKAASTPEPEPTPAITADELGRNTITGGTGNTLGSGRVPGAAAPLAVDDAHDVPSQIVHIGTRQIALRIATDERTGAIEITILIPSEPAA